MNGQNGHAQEQVSAADEAADNDDSEDDEKEEEGGAEGAATGGEISAISLFLRISHKLTRCTAAKKKKKRKPKKKKKGGAKKQSSPLVSPSQNYSPTINTPKVKSSSTRTRTTTAPPTKRNDISTA